MTNNELIALLNKHRDATEFGGDVGVEHSEAAWARLSSDLGFDAKLGRATYSLREHLEYWQWKFSHVWMQPASVALSAFALIFGGWIATVNASFDTVPGDVFYPVKLATERVQISLATSGEQRAKLHAEFAGRRLDELNAITSSDLEGKDVRVQAAMDGFQQEIASVNDELVSITSTNPEEAAALAIIVDQKTDAYVAAIVQTVPSGSEESQLAVAESLTAAEESNAQAIDTIVQSHETNQQPQTEESIQKNFQEKLKDLETRTALSLGRLEVIETVLSGKGMFTAAYAARIEDARETVGAHGTAIEEAMDIFAAGGYRTAFDLLADVERQIATSEGIITELEIEITTGL